MAGFGDSFKEGSTAEQFLIWGVLMQVLQPIMAPFLVELTKIMWHAAPGVPLPPDAAAEAVQRRIMSAGDGAGAAEDSGIGQDTFDAMVRLAQRPPDLGLAVQALQRKLVAAGGDDPAELSFYGALTDAGVDASWHPIIAQLAVLLPSGAEVVDAYVKSQISEGDALERFTKAGGDPSWFATAYNAAGEPPAAGQLAEMVHRGMIGWTGTGADALSFEQGLREGHTKNKWISHLQDISEYLPPPRTVTAMYHQGQLDHARAAELLTKYGMPADLVAAYLSDASHTATAKEKELAKGDILTAYQDKLITRAAAQAALVGLKYSAHDAGVLLDIADARRVSAQANAAITRIRALYLAGKITRAAAVSTLETLKVPSTQAGDIVDVWKLEQAKEVKSLTVAQLVDAWHYELISAAQCDAQIIAQGHTALDAWVLRSIKAKVKQPDRPGGEL